MQIKISILAISLALASTGGMRPGQDQRERDAAFSEIQQLEGREQFTQAASRLADYISRYVKTDTPLFVILQFRLAYDRELSGDTTAAAAAYCACQTHARITDQATTFAGSSVKELVQMRLSSLHFNCERPMTISTITTRSGKGGIRVEPVDPLLPYSSEEALTIAARVRSIDDVHGAENVSKKLFGSHSSVPMGYASKEGLVLAVRRGSDSYAREYINSLAETTRTIRATYFEGRPTRRTLYIYASQDDEVGGKELSMAVHFRSMGGREAYYEPLDHSVVLRKPDPYQGTAAHELTHALVSEDFGLAPRWLDEGYASLQEEQGASGPLDNYRLYYLREALKKSALPRLHEILDSDSDGWYMERAPIFAAYSRYLAMYLLQRDPTSPRLLAVYARMKAAEGDRRSPDVALRILNEITGRGENDLEADFVRFVQDRDESALSAKWGRLRRPIADLVEQIADR